MTPEKKLLFPDPLRPTSSVSITLTQRKEERTYYIVPRTEGVDFRLILVGLEALDGDLQTGEHWIYGKTSTCFMCMMRAGCTKRDAECECHLRRSERAISEEKDRLRTSYA